MSRRKYSRRPWTAAELAELDRLYPTHTASEIAAALGRTVRSVYGQAESRGLMNQSRCRVDVTFDDAVRQMNARGLPDAEIARSIGCDRHTVSRRRRQFDLPSNAKGEWFREKIRAATKRQLQRCGLPSLADVRAEAFRRYAARRGWPPDIAPTAVHILDALDERGPMTRREIADAIGMPWHGSRSSLKCTAKHGGSYLAGLIRRGLVVQLGRIVRGEGRGRSVCLYSLSLTAQRRFDGVETCTV